MLIPIPEGWIHRMARLPRPLRHLCTGYDAPAKREDSALVIGGGSIGLALVRLLKIMGFGPIALSEPMEEKEDPCNGFRGGYSCGPV